MPSPYRQTCPRKKILRGDLTVHLSCFAHRSKTLARLDVIIYMLGHDVLEEIYQPFDGAIGQFPCQPIKLLYTS